MSTPDEYGTRPQGSLPTSATLTGGAEPLGPPRGSVVPAGHDVPLHLPMYDIGLRAAVVRYFKKYADFSGRASRSEYWYVQAAWFMLAIASWTVLGAAAVVVAKKAYTTNGPPWPIWVLLIGGFIFACATVIPSLAITWRRLHDANLSGLFYLFALIPYVGGLVVLVLCAQRSNPLGVRFDRGFAGYVMMPPAKMPPTEQQAWGRAPQ